MGVTDVLGFMYTHFMDDFYTVFMVCSVVVYIIYWSTIAIRNIYKLIRDKYSTQKSTETGKSKASDKSYKDSTSPTLSASRGRRSSLRQVECGPRINQDPKSVHWTDFSSSDTTLNDLNHPFGTLPYQANFPEDTPHTSRKYGSNQDNLQLPSDATQINPAWSAVDDLRDVADGCDDTPRYDISPGDLRCRKFSTEGNCSLINEALTEALTSLAVGQPHTFISRDDVMSNDDESLTLLDVGQQHPSLICDKELSNNDESLILLDVGQPHAFLTCDDDLCSEKSLTRLGVGKPCDFLTNDVDQDVSSPSLHTDHTGDSFTDVPALRSCVSSLVEGVLSDALVSLSIAQPLVTTAAETQRVSPDLFENIPFDEPKKLDVLEIALDLHDNSGILSDALESEKDQNIQSLEEFDTELEETLLSAIEINSRWQSRESGGDFPLLVETEKRNENQKGDDHRRTSFSVYQKESEPTNISEYVVDQTESSDLSGTPQYGEQFYVELYPPQTSFVGSDLCITSVDITTRDSQDNTEHSSPESNKNVQPFPPESVNIDDFTGEFADDTFCSGDKESHFLPDSAVDLFTLSAGGESWSDDSDEEQGGSPWVLFPPQNYQEEGSSINGECDPLIFDSMSTEEAERSSMISLEESSTDVVSIILTPDEAGEDIFDLSTNSREKFFQFDQGGEGLLGWNNDVVNKVADESECEVSDWDDTSVGKSDWMKVDNYIQEHENDLRKGWEDDNAAVQSQRHTDQSPFGRVVEQDFNFKDVSGLPHGRSMSPSSKDRFFRATSPSLTSENNRSADIYVPNKVPSLGDFAELIDEDKLIRSDLICREDYVILNRRKHGTIESSSGMVPLKNKPSLFKEKLAWAESLLGTGEGVIEQEHQGICRKVSQQDDLVDITDIAPRPLMEQDYELDESEGYTNPKQNRNPAKRDNDAAKLELSPTQCLFQEKLAWAESLLTSRDDDSAKRRVERTGENEGDLEGAERKRTVTSPRCLDSVCDLYICRAYKKTQNICITFIQMLCVYWAVDMFCFNAALPTSTFT